MPQTDSSFCVSIAQGMPMAAYYSLGGKVEEEQTQKKNKSISRARLNLLKLSSLQHQMLLRWFNDCRMTYNLALRYIFDHGWHKQDYLLSDKFQPDKMKTLLQKMFVSVPGIQFQDSSLVASLKAQSTKLKQLKKKCPNMPHVKFVLKYKEKRSWTSDCISVEKRSCNLSPVDPRQNLGPSKTRFHDKQKLERIMYLGSSKFHVL